MNHLCPITGAVPVQATHRKNVFAAQLEGPFRKFAQVASQLMLLSVLPIITLLVLVIADGLCN